MDKNYAALHPGNYVIERRYKPDGRWEILYRDNDLEVMRSRFDYWKTEVGLPIGEAIRLFAPDCTLMDEFSVDGPPVPCEVVT